MDALSGQVTSYDMNWRPDVKIPATGTPVPVKELTEKATNELGMALIYQVPYRNYAGKAPEAKLIYQLNTQELMFNASNGKAVDYHGKEKEMKDIRMFEDIPKITGFNNPPAFSGQRITMEKARGTAEKFFRSLSVEGEVKKTGGGSSSGPLGDQEFWSFSIEPNDSSRHYHGTDVGIDQISGRIINYHEFDPEIQADDGSSKITQEEALAKAGEFIKKVAPEYSPYLAPEKSSVEWYGGEKEQGYNFHFYRVVNGIPFPQDGIHIVISSDGKIRHYDCEWHKVTFPETQNVVTPEDAARKWLELSPLQLAYFFPREEGKEKQSNQAILVYRPDYNGFSTIDALTGKPVAYDGLPANKTSGNGYDFKQSWATQYLEILAGSSILPPPDQFSPTDAVKKRDAARLMTAAMSKYYDNDENIDKQFQDINPEDPDFNAIQAGALQGVYDKGGNFNPDQPVTRLTLARWMVNAMGYAEVTKINNNITSSYKDIASLSATDRNYIGLAQGLGIMRGDETGLFKPSDNVTWEELAAVVINSAPKMRNKMGTW